MPEGMEVDPAAIQAFAAMMADAKTQLDQIKARIEKPRAAAEHFGRSWQEQGAQYVESWGMLGPDLASLSTVLEQVQTQLAQGVKLTVHGELANVGTFTEVEAEMESTDTPPSESGGI
jgi:uncharacterized protein YukE